MKKTALCLVVLLSMVLLAACGSSEDAGTSQGEKAAETAVPESITSGADPFDVVVDEVMLVLQGWYVPQELDEILGAPLSQEEEVLGEEADTYAGSTVLKKKYEEIAIALFSPAGNGETFYIMEMEIAGGRFATGDGIKIGSPVSDVTRIFPQGGWVESPGEKIWQFEEAGRSIAFLIQEDLVKRITTELIMP